MRYRMHSEDFLQDIFHVLKFQHLTIIWLDVLQMGLGTVTRKHILWVKGILQNSYLRVLLSITPQLACYSLFLKVDWVIVKPWRSYCSLKLLPRVSIASEGIEFDEQNGFEWFRNNS